MAAPAPCNKSVLHIPAKCSFFPILYNHFCVNYMRSSLYGMSRCFVAIPMYMAQTITNESKPNKYALFLLVCSEGSQLYTEKFKRNKTSSALFLKVLDKGRCTNSKDVEGFLLKMLFLLVFRAVPEMCVKMRPNVRQKQRFF